MDQFFFILDSFPVVLKATYFKAHQLDNMTPVTFNNGYNIAKIVT